MFIIMGRRSIQFLSPIYLIFAGIIFIGVVLFLGLMIFDIVGRNFDRNLQELHFERRGKQWVRRISNMELRAGSSNVMAKFTISNTTKVYWMAADINYPHTFCINSLQKLSEKNVQPGTSLLDSEEAVNAARRLFETGMIRWIESACWDPTNGENKITEIGPLTIGSYSELRRVFRQADHPGSNGIVGAVLRMPSPIFGIYMNELEESDIQAIADFFSALKRAGSR
ncbi:MAG: hypothetical protein Q7T16_02930 [Candidatus Burarchaeum sp.]|nr:hypothetical protein [Candidatus Burarchaeum sp.]MDO8339589.1 hypothetical protein [Candidatus Burarchaeum sp.]